MKHEGGGGTNSNRCTRNGLQRLGKGAEEIGN